MAANSAKNTIWLTGTMRRRLPVSPTASTAEATRDTAIVRPEQVQAMMTE